MESQSAQGGKQGGGCGGFDFMVNAVDVEGEVHEKFLR
jgi:hypothetical protein